MGPEPEPEIEINSINEIETDNKAIINKPTSTSDNNNNNTNNIKPIKKSKKKTQSILQLKLGSLALKISYIGMVAAAFTFVILCIRLFVEEFAIKQLPWTNSYFKYILSYLVQAVTVIVVAVPEGLPLAVALALSFAVRVRLLFIYSKIFLLPKTTLKLFSLFKLI